MVQYHIPCIFVYHFLFFDLIVCFLCVLSEFFKIRLLLDSQPLCCLCASAENVGYHDFCQFFWQWLMYCEYWLNCLMTLSVAKNIFPFVICFHLSFSWCLILFGFISILHEIWIEFSYNVLFCSLAFHFAWYMKRCIAVIFVYMAIYLFFLLIPSVDRVIKAVSMHWRGILKALFWFLDQMIHVYVYGTLPPSYFIHVFSLW